MTWKPAITAPSDQPIIMLVPVQSSANKAFVYWEYVSGIIDSETGEFTALSGDSQPWNDPRDYDYWMPATEPPSGWNNDKQ